MEDTLLVATKSKPIADGFKSEFKRYYKVNVKKEISEIIDSINDSSKYVVIDAEVAGRSSNYYCYMLMNILKTRKIRSSFIVRNIEDIRKLEKCSWNIVGPDSIILQDKGKNKVNSLVDSVSKYLNPDLWRRIKFVAYNEKKASFLVVFCNNKIYELDRAYIDEENKEAYDISDVIVDKEGYNFIIHYGSGDKHEVPWDYVLYHCEPEYEYYKGKEDKSAIRDRDRKIGEKIKELRVGRGITQKQLADLTGIERSNISRLESGKHMVTLPTLERIADALKIQVIQLI